VSLLKTEMELLRRVPLFSGVEPSKLKLLAYTSDPVTYHEGQVLFHMGDRGDAAYVIVHGQAEVSVPTDAGEIPIAVLSDGDFVGEISILCDVPRTATVTARSELQTLRIRKEPFLQLIGQFPQIAVGMLRTLADRLSRTTGELVEAQRQLAARGQDG
jgi:CRP/FNR family transcriptional regulator, cyclic AMP receptor protein